MPNLAAHRRRIARRMTATVQMVHNDGTTWDPETESPIPNIVVDYEGPAHVRPTASTARVVEAAGDVISLRTYNVWLPHDADPGDLAERLVVTSSTGDASLVGPTLWILDRPHDDWQTARMMVCQTQA